MGLMYLFPVSKDEAHVKIAENKITVRTYGLPWIFWGYALASLAVIIGMYLAVKAPLEKLKSVGDGIDLLIYYGLCTTMALIPFTLISFFFFEKKITREKNKLTLSYHLFGIKFWQKTIQLNPTNRFTLDHFLNSPNMARIENKDELSGFQNKGYFELFAINHKNQKILIDRHTRKVDLEKLMHLLDAGTLNE